MFTRLHHQQKPGTWSKLSKHKLKMINLLRRLTPVNDPCIIVASNGRSGSTLMYDALRQANKRRHRPRRAKSVFESRLETAALHPGTLVKTHDFPDALKTRANVKTLFCFGSTKDSALSVYSAIERFGRDWVDEHFDHLHASGPVEDLFRRDVLNQASQMERWGTFEDSPVLCLHYEAIWTRQADVADFLGLKFQVPERVERAKKTIPDDILAQAAALYDPIDAVLDELPQVFVASKDHADILNKLPSQG